MADFQGKYTGDDIDARLDKVKSMVGSTDSSDGAEGLVPAPRHGETEGFPSW